MTEVSRRVLLGRAGLALGGLAAAWGLASPPRPVREAIAEHRQALDEDTYAALGREVELDSAAVAAAARYLRTDYGRIALTDSTTMGLGLVFNGLHLQPGDEVLSSEHDFYSTQESLRLCTERSGATLRTIPLYESPAQASADVIVSRVSRRSPRVPGCSP